MDHNPVLFEELPGEEGDLGIITLNRPEKLNSLNHQMINAMKERLACWSQDEKIKGVVIRGAGERAFCAGGDLRELYQQQKANKQGDLFFHDEYQLNRAIYHFPKPYIAFLDGITMGGGAGVSLHGSHQVGTPQLLFAMPETGIGFYPDVGGTYFLSRIRNYLGIYLGLTGAKIKAADCCALGIIQHVVPRESLDLLIEALRSKPFGQNPQQEVSNIIQQFSIESQNAILLQEKELIECFSASSIEQILVRLETAKTDICKNALEALLLKSPTSLKVTLAALSNAASLSFDECMNIEDNLTPQFLAHHDFMEGIRAVIIDKDYSPKWQPTSLADTPSSFIREFFEKIDTNQKVS